MRRDAALKESVELGSLMNCGSSQPVLASVCAMKLTACCCARAVQGGVLGAVALVVERCIRRPLGLPADSLHDGAPRGGEPARSQAVLRASFALSAACRRVPSAAGLLQVPVRRSSRQLRARCRLDRPLPRVLNSSTMSARSSCKVDRPFVKKRAEVGFRRPPTFGSQIRRAADSLKRVFPSSGSESTTEVFPPH